MPKLIAVALMFVGSYVITKTVYRLGAKSAAKAQAKEAARIKYENEYFAAMNANFDIWRADLAARTS